MDNFNLRKYLTEGKLLKEEYTYNEFIKDNFPRINVKKEEIGIKPALKALGVESGDEIEELTNTMDSTNTALYLTNAKENGYLKELPIRSEYFEKAYLGKWKNGETIVVFSDGWDEFVYFRKSLAEGKLNENKDTISQLIMLLSNAIPLADDLMEDENVGEMYDFVELSQQLENFVNDLKNL
jgi:hypothetical protein